MYKGYNTHFNRLQNILTRDELRDHSSQIGVRADNDHARKLRNLFRDCFSSHVIPSFSAKQNEIIKSEQADRFANSDNISNFFLKNAYYQMPKISQSMTSNEEEIEEDLLSYEDFKKIISTNPINPTNDQNNNELGTNKVSYLVGNVGEGKSTFISKLHQDFENNMREKLNDTTNGEYVLVPILVDFEVSHKKVNGYLEDIDDKFWAKFYETISTKLCDNKILCELAQTDKWIVTPTINGHPHSALISHIRNLIHHLAMRNIRLIVIFDNLDGFYFRYTKYSLFKKGLDAQDTSFNKNMITLVNSFEQEHFATCGLCVLFVCRKDLYLRLDSSGTFPREKHSSFYQLIPVSAEAVVSSRIELLKHIDSQFKPNDFKEFLNYLIRFFYFNDSESEKGLPTKIKHSPIFNSLCQLGHNNFRSMIRFLHELSINPYDIDVVKRLLGEQNHLLSLLYITNNRQRYSQAQNHFPNLFLCDCVVYPHEDYKKEAHLPHKHTYWLKYFILKYLYFQDGKREHPTISHIVNLFTTAGKYEKHLVLLALGSLCDTECSSCLTIDREDASTDIYSARPYLTNRGRYLMSCDKYLFKDEIDVDFCFTFQYLQLVVDDRFLAIPRQWCDKVFNYDPKHHYSYLYKKELEYKKIAPQVLKSKFYSVLYFLRVLKASLHMEQKLHNDIYTFFLDNNLLPDFDDVNEYIIQTIGKISPYNKSIAEFKEEQSRINDNTDFELFFETFCTEQIQVEL